jgi:hypothetical protein
MGAFVRLCVAVLIAIAIGVAIEGPSRAAAPSPANASSTGAAALGLPPTSRATLSVYESISAIETVTSEKSITVALGGAATAAIIRAVSALPASSPPDCMEGGFYYKLTLGAAPNSHAVVSSPTVVGDVCIGAISVLVPGRPPHFLADPSCTVLRLADADVGGRARKTRTALPACATTPGG